MRKPSSASDLYWRSKLISQIKSDYSDFLDKEGMENTPHAAYVFMLSERGKARVGRGLSERDIIKALAGALPPNYD